MKGIFYSIFLLVFILFLNNCGALPKETIKLQHIPAFLSNEDCDHLINIAKDKFSRSGVTLGTASGYSENRTSYTHVLEKSGDDIIRNIEQRASSYTKTGVQNLENLQVVRYLPGQQFKEHHDWFGEDYLQQNNVRQRQYTIFVYLNDVDDGGETYFPKIDVSFKPKKGDAIFWENCVEKSKCHDASLHAGRPPTQGIKFGLNIWSVFAESN